jgi:hypothetical protein
VTVLRSATFAWWRRPFSGAILAVMAQERLPTRQARRSDLPSRVSITVTHVPADRARRLREMRAGLANARWSLCVALALAAVTVAAVVGVQLASRRTDSAGAAGGAAQAPSPAAVAAAFGYPRRCLNIVISAFDRDYATAHVDRTGDCAKYRGYINGSFHRVHGDWRLILDEGQLFVPNSLLSPAPARSSRADGVSGYPLGCLSVEITLQDPRFARAGFDRRLACVRDRG